MFLGLERRQSVDEHLIRHGKLIQEFFAITVSKFRPARMPANVAQRRAFGKVGDSFDLIHAAARSGTCSALPYALTSLGSEQVDVADTGGVLCPIPICDAGDGMHDLFDYRRPA
jgi:hypothetical protein